MKLDGEVGVIGNGAGLVMSTLDVMWRSRRRAGLSSPPTSSTLVAELGRMCMAAGLDVILGDEQVKSVFVERIRWHHRM